MNYAPPSFAESIYLGGKGIAYIFFSELANMNYIYAPLSLSLPDGEAGWFGGEPSPLHPTG